MTKATPPRQHDLLTEAIQAIVGPALDARNRLIHRAAAHGSIQQTPYSKERFEKIFGALPPSAYVPSQPFDRESTGRSQDSEQAESRRGSSTASADQQTDGSLLASGSALRSSVSSMDSAQARGMVEKRMTDAEYEAEHRAIVAAQVIAATDARIARVAAGNGAGAGFGVVSSTGSAAASAARGQSAAPMPSTTLPRAAHAPSSAVLQASGTGAGVSSATTMTLAGMGVVSSSASAAAAAARGQSVAPMPSTTLPRAAHAPSSAVTVGIGTPVAGSQVSVVPAPPPRSAAVGIASRPTSSIALHNQTLPPHPTLSAGPAAAATSAHDVAAINWVMGKNVVSDFAGGTATGHTGDPPHRGENVLSQVNRPATASAEEFDDDAGDGTLPTPSVPLATASVAAGASATTTRRFNKGSR